MLQGTPGTKYSLAIGIHPAEPLFRPEEHHSKLGVSHAPFAADVVLLTSLEIEAAKNPLIAFRQFGKTLVDCLAHLEDFGFGTHARFFDRDIRIGERFAANAAAILQDDIPADTIHKRAEVSGVIANLALAARANETSEGFLDNIVHVRAVMSDVIQHLVTELQPKPLERGFGELHGQLSWDRPDGHKCVPHSNNLRSRVFVKMTPGKLADPSQSGGLRPWAGRLRKPQCHGKSE